MSIQKIYDFTFVIKISNNPAFCARYKPKPKPAYQTMMRTVNFVFIDCIRSYQINFCYVIVYNKDYIKKLR